MDLKDEIINNLSNKIITVENRINKLESVISELSSKMESKILESELNTNKINNKTNFDLKHNKNHLISQKHLIAPLNFSNIQCKSSSQPNTTRNQCEYYYSCKQTNKQKYSNDFFHKFTNSQLNKQLFFQPFSSTSNRKVESLREFNLKSENKKFQTLQAKNNNNNTSNTNTNNDLMSLQLRTKTILEKYREFSKSLISKIKSKNFSYNN